MLSQQDNSLRVVVHTLGPRGTNCEAAAKLWLNRTHGGEGEIELHGTLEEGLDHLWGSPNSSVLLGCVVYPDLHGIVFKNLGRLELVDQFIMPTFNMVYASRGQDRIRTAATHPAPRSLLDGKRLSVTVATSNSKAAMLCRSGDVDSCITTLPAADEMGLTVLEDFGPVPMGFTVHAPKVLAR